MKAIAPDFFCDIQLLKIVDKFQNIFSIAKVALTIPVTQHGLREVPVLLNGSRQEYEA